MNPPNAYPPAGGYGPPPQAPPAAATPVDPRAGVLARLPLQIGHHVRVERRAGGGIVVSRARALVVVAILDAARYARQAFIVVLAAGGLLVVYSIGHMRAAVRTRASDILLYPDGLLVDGGRLHGQRVPWGELTAPYAEIEDTFAKRLTIGSIFKVILALLVRSNNLFGGVTSQVRVWRLYVHQKGERRLIAETDRPIERDSMAAAAASVSAVVSGQRYVAEAPTVPARILSCPSCGAPAVPDDAAFVTCAFCSIRVPLPDEIRGQAAAAKAMSQSRGTTAGIIAKLRDQPRAAHTNRWMAILAVLMFGAWPIGWGLIAVRVLGDGFQASDLFCLLLPFAAVVAGFFLSRARLADRGALQLLTLGFGALSPRKEGEPSRCRRCQGPLPSAGLGGVTQCRYCSAENIVGLDLRPSVDPARAEQANFDEALKKRASEKRLWTTLSVVALFALLCWIGGTVAYILHMEADARSGAHDTGKTHPHRDGPMATDPPQRKQPPAAASPHTPEGRRDRGHRATEGADPAPLQGRLPQRRLHDDGVRDRGPAHVLPQERRRGDVHHAHSPQEGQRRRRHLHARRGRDEGG